MRVLVTRPEPDATQFAQALRARGHEPVLCPLMRIELSSEAPPEGSSDAVLLFTSANGVRAAAAHGLSSVHGAFAVGPATAAAAEAAGYAVGGIANGDVASLAKLVADDLPTDQKLVHVAGTDLAGDLRGALAAAGYQVARWTAYRAVAAERLPDAALSFLKIPGGAAALFSPRTARLLGALMEGAGARGLAAGHIALCLSAAVGQTARAAPWREIRIAARPEQEALIALLG